MPVAGLRHGWIRSGGRRIEEKGVFSKENFFRKWLKRNSMEVRDIYRGLGKVKGL